MATAIAKTDERINTSPKLMTAAMETSGTPESCVRKRTRQPTSAKDMFAEGSLVDVAHDYPMLCFCDDQKPCKLRCCGGGHNGRLPTSKMILFGLPFLGWYALAFMKRSTMKPFYTDDYPQASLGYIAFFSCIGVVIDAFTDPFMANLTDNVRPACWGRRRPFVLLGGIMALIIFVMSYLPLVSSGIGASIWFGVFHIGTKLVDTVLMIPLDAWGAEMTPRASERSTLWTSREIFLIFGVLLGSVLPGLSTNLGGLNCTQSPTTGCIGLPVLALLFGLLCLLGCLLLVFLGKERPNERLPVPVAPKSGDFVEDGIVPILISTWLNRPFRCLIITGATEAFGINLPFVVLPYFTRVVLGDACMDPSLMFSVLAATNLIARMLVLPIWLWIGKRLGKFNAFLIFNFALAAAHCLFLFVGRDTESCSMMPFLLTATGIWGMVFSGGLFLRSIMSDIADYDEFLTGKRREAQYMMTLEFLPKFFEVPSEALPILLMAYFGYVRPSNDVLPSQPDAVVWLIRLCVSLVPAFFILAGSIVLCFYPQQARTNEAHKELIIAIREKHAKGLSAEDPWFPGSIVTPPPVAGPHDDLLAYFWPSEIRTAIEHESQSGHCSSLRWGTMKGVAVGLFLFPLGITFIVAGWKDMNTDLGASVSPIGLVFLGIALLLISFDGTRLRAAFALEKRSTSQAELVARYNYLCRFTGSAQVVSAVEVPHAGDESIDAGDA